MELTRPEVEALTLLSRGLRGKQAARELGISRMALFLRVRNARERNGCLSTYELMYRVGQLVARQEAPLPGHLGRRELA